MESLLAFKRAGADGILTYFAPRVAEEAEGARLDEHQGSVARAIGSKDVRRVCRAAFGVVHRPFGRLRLRHRRATRPAICRSALPGLNPDARITVLRSEAGAGAANPADRLRSRSRGSSSRSNASSSAALPPRALSPNKAELVDIATEHGPFSGAEPLSSASAIISTARRALRAIPGAARDLGARVLAVPDRSPIRCSSSWSSLPRTAIYGLLAVAYALVFGLIGRINLAFGELAAVGSAATVAGAVDPHRAWNRRAPRRASAAASSAPMFAGARLQRGRRLFRHRPASAATAPSRASSRRSACHCS